MKRTRDILAVIFTVICVVAVALYVAVEFLGADLSVWDDVPGDVMYVLQTVVILLSLAVVPLSLYLFKIPKIHADLMERKADALLKWGTIRMAMLGILLIGNTLLYYFLGFEPAFGYLAIITAMVMPFIIPTMKRCITETTPQPQEPSETPESPEVSKSPESPESPKP